jgi:hypothetical protein
MSEIPEKAIPAFGIPIIEEAANEEKVDPSSIPSSGAQSDLISQHNEQMNSQENEKPDDDVDVDEELEVLEPLVDSKRWVVGKPPENGGKDTQYEVYYQSKLGFMARNRFFALVGKTLSEAIRATGGDIGGMGDVFGQGEGTILQRGKRLREHDFKDASSFFALAMELVGYSADFLSECYVLFLDVPRNDRDWFKRVIETKYDPENDKWGLSDEAGMEMIELFIYQNYEDIRSFFVEKLPIVAKRAAQMEKDRKAKEELHPSK